jgi:hypothetical protein
MLFVRGSLFGLLESVDVGPCSLDLSSSALSLGSVELIVYAGVP